MDSLLLKSLLFSSLYSLYSQNFFLSDACIDQKIKEDLDLVNKHFTESSIEHQILYEAIEKTKEHNQNYRKMKIQLQNDSYFKEQFSK